MYSNIYGLRAHLIAGMKAFREEKLRFQCLAIEPYGNDPAAATWEGNTLFVIYELVGDYDIVNMLGDLPLRHNALFTGFATYRTQRLAVTGQMAGTVEGRVAVSDLTREQEASLLPRMAMLDGIIDQLLLMTEEALSDVFKALLAVIKIRGEVLGEKLEYTMPNPSGVEVALRSPPKVGRPKRLKRV